MAQTINSGDLLIVDRSLKAHSNQLVLATIEKGNKLDNKEIVKAMMVPDITERE